MERKTIVITGASKGIGYAVAEKCVREHKDLQLAICSRHEADILKAKEKLLALNPNASILAMKCDVSDRAQVSRFAQTVQASFGVVDVLVNNAGFGMFKPVHEFSTQEFSSILETNLRGVFLITQEVLPEMRKRRQGTIITIGSLASKNGFAGGSAYCASKFGVRGLMQSLFLEVREQNIRVITIFPGSVDTEFFVDDTAQSIKSNKALKAENIADCVYFCYSLPQYADLSELDIRPTNPKG